MSLLSLFSNDVAVSLVDDAFIFSAKSPQSTPVVLPAYVAVQAGTKRVLSCGEEAKAMLGKTPDNIQVMRVLVGGNVDYIDAATALFRHGLAKVAGSGKMIRPRVIVAVNSSELNKTAVKQVSAAGGAREIYLIEIGMATAIGMKIEPQEPELKGVLIVSDDWFDFSVISLSGIVVRANGGIGTRAFVEDAQNHCVLTRQFRPDAEALEARLMAGGIDAKSAAAGTVRGWETWAGSGALGRVVETSLSGEDIAVGVMPSLIRMTERIKSAIRTLPAESQYQLTRMTIHASGSAMGIPGLGQAIAAQLGQPVTPFQAAVHPSIEGCRLALEELKFLRRVRTADTQRRR